MTAMFSFTVAVSVYLIVPASSHGVVVTGAGVGLIAGGAAATIIGPRVSPHKPWLIAALLTSVTTVAFVVGWSLSVAFGGSSVVSVLAIVSIAGLLTAGIVLLSPEFEF
jgi:hypothetical protein